MPISVLLFEEVCSSGILFLVLPFLFELVFSPSGHSSRPLARPSAGSLPAAAKTFYVIGGGGGGGEGVTKIGSAWAAAARNHPLLEEVLSLTNLKFSNKRLINEMVL